MAIEDVRQLLQQFQEGYTQRDPNNLASFMNLFVADDTLEVIGTNATVPNKGEWCRGQEATKALIEGDWEHWGDVVFDVAGAHIFIEGNVAWLATTATVRDTFPLEKSYGDYLEWVKGTLEEEELDAKNKMLDIIRLGTEMLIGMQHGETYVWPFRFTAVAIKNKNIWQFRQMHFSFPTTREPDVRY